MKDVAQVLKKKIDDAKPKLLALSEERASEKPYADKWSLKETLGHLLDSATNNHQRIVRMQQVPDIGRLTYDQLRWVRINAYATEPWREMVEFWYLFNAHLAHVIAHVDPATLENTCDMGYAKPAPLRFVIEDYVRHLEHHLGQIFAEGDPRDREKWVSRVPS